MPDYVILINMPGFINELTVFAPAKVNLHLAVSGRRGDGYHDIQSVFLAVDFGDTLRITAEDGACAEAGDECELMASDSLAQTSIPDNIILKAASVFRQKTGYRKRLKVLLDKRIPTGGGLGGGSSDAASTLLALNKMAGFPCNREELLEMALSLGSDVPFFIHETSAAIITGRGEIITPVKAPLLYLVLVNPGFSSDTAAAFRLLDESRRQDRHFIREAALPLCDNFFDYFTHSDSGFIPFNDFLPVFIKNGKSVYEKIICALRSLGAFYANISGSGSTCFGVFSDMAQAQKAAGALSEHWKFIEIAKSNFVSNFI